MKKSLFFSVILFISLTTYVPKSNFFLNFNLNIREIIIENNSVVESAQIKEKLNFLYNESLFFLDTKDIEKNLKEINFIQSFSIKKIYPKKLKLIITEKNPIAIVQIKKISIIFLILEI